MEEEPHIRRKRVSFKGETKFEKTTRMNSQEIERDLGCSEYGESGVGQLETSFAFNPSKPVSKSRITFPAAAQTAVSAVTKVIVETIKSPRKSFKARATRATAGKLAKLAKPARSYFSRKADLDILEAHDDLARAKAYEKGKIIDHPDEAHNIGKCQSRVDDLLTKRETMRIAWITGRHVRRVKVVDSSPRSFPSDKYFEDDDDCGAREYQWGKWLGYKLLHYSRPFTAQYVSDDLEELSYSAEVIRRDIERLVTASAPMQIVISKIRLIYVWHNPAKTAAWMVTYFILWYISHIMTFLYGYVVYAVLKNYYFPTTLEALRESVDRSGDGGATALKIDEIISRDGDEKYLGPMIESLGPHLQVQLADLANILEMLYNFYHWKRPAKTRATLVLFSTFFLVCLLTDLDYCFRIVYFLGGLTFFLLWPISSRYPRYRLLVSPLRWLFWDVPTHAEWSFQYLQERSNAIKSDVQRGEAKKTITETRREGAAVTGCDPKSNESFTNHGDFESHDIVSFPCSHKHTAGHLILSSTDFRFKASIFRVSSDPVIFDYNYGDLEEMRKRGPHLKVLSPVAKITNELDSLELRVRTRGRKMDNLKEWADKPVLETLKLDNIIGRDKAFNLIVGFSGMRWQNLEG